MRVVLATNVFISVLLVEISLPAGLIDLWRNGKFVFLSARQQLRDLVRVTRYPKIKSRLNLVLAGRLIEEIKGLAVLIGRKRGLPSNLRSENLIIVVVLWSCG